MRRLDTMSESQQKQQKQDIVTLETRINKHRLKQLFSMVQQIKAKLEKKFNKIGDYNKNYISKFIKEQNRNLGTET